MIQPALTSGRQLLRKVFIWPHRALCETPFSLAVRPAPEILQM